MAKSKHLLQKKKKEDPFNTIQIQEDKELAALPFCKVLPLTSLFHLSLSVLSSLWIYIKIGRRKKDEALFLSWLSASFRQRRFVCVRRWVGWIG
jgi:hypothetical protein